MTKQTLMAVGAHADDVEFNAGGTLMKYLDRGYQVVYVMSTNNMSGSFKERQADGSYRRYKMPPEDTMKQRKLDADTAARETFQTEAIHLDHPQRHYTSQAGEKVGLCFGAPKPEGVADGRPTILTAHEYPEQVERVTQLILDHNPEAVLTHGPACVDSEHHGTCLLVSKAYRQAADQGFEGMLLHWPDITYQIPKSLFGRRCFDWDSYIDISGYMERKHDAVRHHASVVPEPEQMQYPEWGLSLGCEHAEPFGIVDWGAKPDDQASFALELHRHAR